MNHQLPTGPATRMKSGSAAHARRVISVQTLMIPGGIFRSVVDMKSERKGLLRSAPGESSGVTDHRSIRVLIFVGLVVVAAAIYAFRLHAVSPSEVTPVITGSPLLPLIVGNFGG
jgi:hypothetical protein